MMVRLGDVRRCLAAMTFDRMGHVRLDDPVDRTRLAIFAHRANAVVEWALRDYLARGCPSDTRAAATLGLALFEAAPEAIPLGCSCRMPDGLRCVHAEAWRRERLEMARGGDA